MPYWRFVNIKNGKITDQNRDHDPSMTPLKKEQFVFNDKTKIFFEVIIFIVVRFSKIEIRLISYM